MHWKTLMFTIHLKLSFALINFIIFGYPTRKDLPQVGKSQQHQDMNYMVVYAWAEGKYLTKLSWLFSFKLSCKH